MKKTNKPGNIWRHRLILCVTITAFFLIHNNIFPQEAQQTPTRQSSTEAFNKGDYKKAYNGFSELLAKYPRDPLYKYYSGVCLVKMNVEPAKAASLLIQARQGSAVVRTIPSDAVFWLGRAQQMSGKFSEAIASYNDFANQAGKKAARELGVENFIKQCNEGEGQIAESHVMAEVREKEKAPAEKADNKQNAISTNKDFQSDKTSLPSDYDVILSEALAYQTKADSLSRIAEEQKKRLDEPGNKLKAEMKVRITDTENLAASFQKQADQKYAEAQRKMNGEAFVASEVKPRPSAPVEDTASKLIKPEIKDLPGAGTGPNKDTLITKSDTITKTDNQKDSEKSEAKATPAEVGAKSPIQPGTTKKGDVYSVFQVVAKPVFKAGEKVEVNPPVPPGLIYRIQVAVFRNPVAPSYFKGIGPVYGFKVPGTDRTNYYAGMFRRAADANKALVQVRQKGFKDAFVIALSGGKAVSSDRAAVLEKEWGRKPFAGSLKPGQSLLADTIPPTLSFRVEVMRSAKPVKPDITEALKTIAGSRGLDTETASDGSVIYLIGTFITWESASEYAGLLNRNGYREAKVSAWLGKKEIPVDTARQLFEEVK